MGSLTLSVSVQAFVVTELIINTKEAEEEGAHLSDVYWAEWVHCSKGSMHTGRQTEGTAGARWADRWLQYSEVFPVSLKHVSLRNAIIVDAQMQKVHLWRELTTMIYLRISPEFLFFFSSTCLTFHASLSNLSCSEMCYKTVDVAISHVLMPLGAMIKCHF